MASSTINNCSSDMHQVLSQVQRRKMTIQRHRKDGRLGNGAIHNMQLYLIGGKRSTWLSMSCTRNWKFSSQTGFALFCLVVVRICTEFLINILQCQFVLISQYSLDNGNGVYSIKSVGFSWEIPLLGWIFDEKWAWGPQRLFPFNEHSPLKKLFSLARLYCTINITNKVSFSIDTGIPLEKLWLLWQFFEVFTMIQALLT